MANIFSSDMRSLVGRGFWSASEDGNTNQAPEQGLSEAGPSHRQSASYRTRVSTGRWPPFQPSSRVKSPLEELQ